MKKFASFLAVICTWVTAAAVTVPSYINTAANVIELNGADWSALRERLHGLERGDSDVVRVLHIGDSHIQAEFVTNALREKLQEKYGNAGRGLIVPLRLAGTNQSNDYAVTSPSKAWTQTRLLKWPWPVKPGVTGISARADAATTVCWHPLGKGHRIKRARLLTSDGVTDTVLPAEVDSIVTRVPAGQSIYGAITENGRPGLLYSAIGNNGATYNDYLLINGFAEKTQDFNPDLIIISMGTNEAFSYNTPAEMETATRNLIRTLRTRNPHAAMLVLLPMECQRNRNHGRKPLSEYYDVNTRVAEAAAMIARVAEEMNVPVWDFYTVAGGDGASSKWLDDGLMNKDRIHLYKPGYEVQAQLLYNALVNALE